MAAAHLTVDRETEAQRVLSWRMGELERAGYESAAAQKLAEQPYVDLHLAIALARGGCPVATALKILL